MSKLSCLVLAGLLVGADAFAADTPPDTAPAATPGADLEAQLAAARQKLEAAARDVAQLSAQLGQTAMAHLQGLRTRAILGLQLEVEPSAKEQGATIMGVSPGGPAAEAGLTAGDVIVALDGAPIRGPNAPRQVVDHMATVKPDAKVTVMVMRDGKAREFQVTPRAGVAGFIPGFEGPGPGGPGPGRGPGGAGMPWQQLEARGDAVGRYFDGMELAELTPELGQYFGASQGVLVIRVPHDGDFLKLQDGDVILSIDGRVPENGSHASRILRSYQPGEKIHLKILRQKKSLELEGTLPQRPERRHFGPGAPGYLDAPMPRPVPPQ
ncbi:MAG TPA: PDZ domain-containing protein [Steroidobacteraceae bacterium]|nr:PDZ domain-containing protein [Steroidobacteraceae bacterium]